MPLPAPKGLDPAARAAWRRGAAALELLGEDPALSVEPLAAYARAISDVQRLRRQWADDGGRATDMGPRGAMREHPLLRAIVRAEQHAHELSESLGLSPMARRRMARGVGRPPGAASARDRAVEGGAVAADAAFPAGVNDRPIVLGSRRGRRTAA